MYTKIISTIIAFLLCACTCWANGTPGNSNFRLPVGVTASDMVPGVLIIKLKPEYRNQSRVASIENPQLTTVLSKIGATSISKVFPLKEAPATERNAQGKKLADLSLIYKVNYSSQQSIEKIINAILRTGTVVYAEPKYLPHLSFTPNDPNTALQYYLGKIQAYAAWDISQGDTNVVIGITDTGTDLDHPDLEPNLKYNYNDPIDGIDNDNDGYTDNYRGWDLGENDNNPSVNVNVHGSHVTGCAAAATNNNTGVASPGFNCKYLPVKISNASGSLTEAYEGIAYAADMGCAIINCSWGGPGGGSFGQDIIDYATINQNALVIAAAGNNNNDQTFFPGAYNYVLNVASTTNSDSKSSFSNFGANVDVCAPGSNIYTAMSNDNYGFMSGTSMASPVCAGAAAIVKSEFPSLNALQIGEKIRVTSDNIYNIPNNGPYLNKLGKGRINMLNALTQQSPAVRMENFIITDNNDDAFVVNDTVRISGDIINYLDPTTNLDLVISSSSGWVTIIDNNTFVGALGTLASVDNHADPFLIKVNPGAPQNLQVTLKIEFTDGSYSDYQLLDIVVNVDYINVTINQIATTITSKGRLCYNGTGQTEGLGFQYNGENLTYETGLMIGTGVNAVSDNVRGDAGVTDDDFLSAQVVQRLIPTIQSEFDLFGKFNDNPATPSLPVLVSHKALAWSNPGDDKYIIVEYTILNSGNNTINDMWAGIFSDWDIQDYSLNKGDESTSLKMGYVYNTTATGLWAGIKLLTPTPFNHYAVDNLAGQGGVNMSDGYDTGEKYTTLSTARMQSGVNGQGNDVIDVVSTGPFTVAAGDSITVAFALIAGDDLNDINTSAANAQIKYDNLTSVPSYGSGFANVTSYPNPAVNAVYINTGNHEISGIEIVDLSGRLVYSNSSPVISNNMIAIDVSDLSSGSYFIRLLSETGSHVEKMIKN